MKSVIIGSGIFLFIISAGAGTFVETFDDGNLEEWQEITILGVAPASWNIRDGELQAIAKDGDVIHLLTIGDEEWQDYDIEFDVKPLEKHGRGNIAIAARVDGIWGVVCVIGDLPFPEAGSRVTCFGGDLGGNMFVRFKSELTPLLKVGEWSHLKLRVHGKLLSLWINEKQVLNSIVLEQVAHPPDFPLGKVGLGLANYTAKFDNFIITGDTIPNKGKLSVTPRKKLAMTWVNLKKF